jgi:hypothetical protein
MYLAMARSRRCVTTATELLSRRIASRRLLSHELAFVGTGRKKCDRSAARLGDERERLARREDADGAKRIEGPQILIAGDDEAGVGGKRAGEHLIVVGIATDWGDLGGAHELCEGAVTGEQLGDLHLGF